MNGKKKHYDSRKKDNMLLKLNEEEFNMLKREFKHYRCLYWGSKLELPNGYCDGDCHNCTDKRMIFDKWIKSKIVNE